MNVVGGMEEIEEVQLSEIEGMALRSSDLVSVKYSTALITIAWSSGKDETIGHNGMTKISDRLHQRQNEMVEIILFVIRARSGLQLSHCFPRHIAKRTVLVCSIGL